MVTPTLRNVVQSVDRAKNARERAEAAAAEAF